jgi:plastocyanin
MKALTVRGTLPRRLATRGGLALAALALVAAGVACSSKPAAESGERPGAAGGGTVTVQGFMFRPERLQVKVGTTVTWTNRDQILHTATSGTPGMPSGVFDGEMPEAGKSFSFTFREPGTYPYFCSRHNSMRGEIVVTQ